jgi:HlyD family secretion protein
MKKGIVLAALVLAAAIVVWRLAARDGEDGRGYRFVTIERGNIASVVSSTGILQATTTVEVGTQVSGKIAEIYVDFNDRVVKDQLIARIDPTLLEHEVRAAEANIERNTAEREQARRDLDRARRLYETQAATESEFQTAEYKHAVAEAALKSAEVNLERAERNLGYTEIRAPISGIVLDRKMDVGQTVAASFSAPLLFLIAEDLEKMEILASVDESDIGKIRQGGHARFTVQAYPNESFQGTVAQVRLQSSTQENVVSYTVVLSVDNQDGRLLPGMTATVDCIVEEVFDVMKVPSAALRFRPTDAMIASLRKNRAGR